MINSHDYDGKEFRMNTKIKELNGLTPEAILNEYGDETRSKLPIDIADILFKMEIRVLPFDFSEIDLTDRILGAMIADETNLALLYRQGESKNRSRFTLAHELAHCCLAHLDDKTMPYVEYRHEGKTTDEDEIKANIFAGELLVPLKELRMVLSKYYPDTMPHSSKLAEMFAVSVNVMEERLRYLQIPYVDEYNRKNICLE